MARYDARAETYQEIRVLGKPALFHDMRFDRGTIPKDCQRDFSKSFWKYLNS